MQNAIKNLHLSYAADTALGTAWEIAGNRMEDEVHCSHLLGALLLRFPEVVEDLLEKDISGWGRDADLMERDTARKSPAERRRARRTAGRRSKEVVCSDELAVLLLDASEDTPLHFIKGFFPDRVIGVAELAFIILKEPSKEIGDILAEYGVTNDADELSTQLCRNYLLCCEKYSDKAPRDRFCECIEMGKRFSAYMKSRIVGQEKAIETLAVSLVNFWYKGNDLKPWPVILFSKAGGGKSFFAEVLQEAFVKLQRQKMVYPVLDCNSYNNDSSVDVELLGENKTFRAAHPGKISEICEQNPRGAVVFEEIQAGCRVAQQLIGALCEGNVRDKFMEKTVMMPFNLLLLTVTLPEDLYAYLMKEGGAPTAQGFAEVLRKQEKMNGIMNAAGGVQYSLLNSVKDFIGLEELEEPQLKEMVSRELKRVEKNLQAEYQVDFACKDVNTFCDLLLQSSPQKMTPKDLASVMHKHLSGIAKAVIKHPETKRISIECEPLPEYLHDMSRRHVRGDYIDFEKREVCKGETYIYSFGNSKYCTQRSIDFGAYSVERPKNVGWDDIVGLDGIKAELQESLDYITGKGQKNDLPPPALNFILVGEPGSGKTATVTALAAMADIPVFFANSALFSDADKVNELFRMAKMMAPCIIIFEEIDSVGNKAVSPWKGDVINTFLAHLDGVEEAAKMLVLGSCNYIDKIEPALLRPGRFSQIIHVGLPDAAARELYIRKFEAKYAFELCERDRFNFVSLTAGKTIAVVKAVLEYGLRKSRRAGEKLDSERLEEAFHHIAGHGRDVKKQSGRIGF